MLGVTTATIIISENRVCATTFRVRDYFLLELLKCSLHLVSVCNITYKYILTPAYAGSHITAAVARRELRTRHLRATRHNDVKDAILTTDL